MSPDPRWLEILKASGWQLLGLTIAFGLFLLASFAGWMPPLSGWATQLTILAFLICGGLWLTSFLSALFKFIPPKPWIAHWQKIAQDRRETRKYTPFMTPKEREIIGYLLSHSQKTFTCDAQGGHAVTLIARGIVVRAMLPGHQYDQLDVPYTIPDHVWWELTRQRDTFPVPPADGPHPWRKGWME